MEGPARAATEGDRIPRQGFTLIEVLFVLMIGGTLAMIAIPRMATYRNQRIAMSARDAFVHTAARARAASIERGSVVTLRIAPAKDSVFVDAPGGTRIEVLDLLDGEMQADLVAGQELTLCYIPRGYVHPGCGNGALLPQRVGFARGEFTAWANVSVAQVTPE